MSFDSFREYMIQLLGDSDSKEEVIDAFFLINRGSDIATEEKLGFVMKDEDVNYVKQTAPSVEGGYDYKAWTEDVFSR